MRKHLSSIVLMLLIILLLGGLIWLGIDSRMEEPLPQKPSPRREIPLTGIDVSHHQGSINWSKVTSDSDILFAMLKATEGVTHTDSRFRQNRIQARKAGLKVGAYHFFRANKGGKAQFEHYRQVVGKDIDLMPVLDLEPESGRMISKSDYRQKVQNFIDDCQAYYGVKPILYINIRFYQDYVYPVGKDCLLWYGYDGVKHMQQIFQEKLKNVVILQFSEKGRLPGIRENVDFDYCNDLTRIYL